MPDYRDRRLDRANGKEANVFLGERGDQDIAIKIYRIRTANFNAMSEYIIGDRRFAGIKTDKKGSHLYLDQERVCKPEEGCRCGLSSTYAVCMGPEYPDHGIPWRG